MKRDSKTPIDQSEPYIVFSPLAKKRVEQLGISESTVRNAVKGWLLHTNLRRRKNGVVRERDLVIYIQRKDHGESVLRYPTGRSSYVPRRKRQTWIITNIHQSVGEEPTTKNSSVSAGMEPPQQSLNEELKIVLKGNLEDVSEADLEILLNRLRSLSGDSSIEIVHIQEGSIILRLSGTEEGFRIIKDLWETGKITSLIGLPIECVDYEITSDANHDVTTSTTDVLEAERNDQKIADGSVNYFFDRCTVNQNNQMAMPGAILQTDSQGIQMSDNYTNNLQGANVANMANTLKDNARQQANQHIHPSEQRKTLAESASEIQKLLKQLEQTNPSATDIEKVAYVNDETSPNFKRRVVGALQAGGEAAIEEFLDNPYVNVGKAIVKGWMKPE